MRTAIALVLLLAACGNKAKGGGDDTLPDPPPPPPAQTELEKRQGAACEQLGPRLTDCAIADARATMSPAELAELDIENTAPLHTREMIKECKQQTMSSRQVRVYEVCMREESECTPLTACLENAAPDAAAGEAAP
jgi:hypothetical protein